MVDSAIKSAVSAKYWSDGAITPSDSTTYDPDQIAGLVVITEGDVVLDDISGNTLTLSSVAANTLLPLTPVKIMAATTADVVVLYNRAVS